MSTTMNHMMMKLMREMLEKNLSIKTLSSSSYVFFLLSLSFFFLFSLEHVAVTESKEKVEKLIVEAINIHLKRTFEI